MDPMTRRKAMMMFAASSGGGGQGILPVEWENSKLKFSADQAETIQSGQMFSFSADGVVLIGYVSKFPYSDSYQSAGEVLFAYGENLYRGCLIFDSETTAYFNSAPNGVTPANPGSMEAITLPPVDSSDNGKVLGVADGAWGAVENLPVLPGVTSTSITPDVYDYIRSGKPFIVGNMVVISGGYNVGNIPAIAIGGGTVRKGIVYIYGAGATRFIDFYDGSDLREPEYWPKYNDFPVILTEGEDAETIFTFLLGMKSVAGSAGNAEWFVPFPNAADVVSFVRTCLTDGSVPIMVYDAGLTNVMRLQFVSDTPNGVTFHGELVDPVSSGNSFTGLDTYPFDMTFCNYGIGVAMTHKEFAAVQI